MVKALVENMSHKNSFVSIIIPIYNAEDSLHNCIESILDQTYKDIEIIMINDGSTDHSKNICDHYAKLDQRIKVIHQENAGPSAARNRGIEQAVGNYIQFVDADDYIKPTMTETLVKAITNNIQLVICGYQSIHFWTLRKYTPSFTGIYQQSDLMQYIGELYRDILLPSPCNKLYDATLINDFQLRFQENVKVGEDLLFNLAYIKTCSRIQMIDKILYNYVIQDDQSLSRDFNKEFFENQHMLHEQVRTFLLEEDYYSGRNKDFLKINYANSIINSLNNLFHQNSVLTANQKKRQIKRILSDIDLEEHANFNESPQSKLLGQLIQKNSLQYIYLFFKVKSSLQLNMTPLYQLLREKFGRSYE